MKIIVRSVDERTEAECLRRVSIQGEPVIIKSEPFGAALLDSYIEALNIGQDFIAMVDADVLLFKDSILEGIKIFKQRSQNEFCLDGMTTDKTLIMNRRAGIHIYKTKLLEKAIKYIDNKKIKPESSVRFAMAELGYPTYAGGKYIFGQHDYEQYYRDLWRKACCQTWKLENLIVKSGMQNKWKTLSYKDNDYKVIFEAYKYSKNNLTADEIVIDKRVDYDAIQNIERLGLKEKGPMEISNGNL